jgi:hypothetical protein
MLTVESWDSLLDVAKSRERSKNRNQPGSSSQETPALGHWSMKNFNENCTRDDHEGLFTLKYDVRILNPPKNLGIFRIFSDFPNFFGFWGFSGFF